MSTFSKKRCKVKYRASSIFWYIVSGFLFYGVSILAFINDPAFATGKWVLMGIFMAPALVALFIGLALQKFRQWKKDIGIVLLSACGSGASVALMGVCFFLTPEMKEFYPNNKLYFFSNVGMGISFIALLGVIGFVLLLIAKDKALHSAAANEHTSTSGH